MRFSVQAVLFDVDGTLVDSTAAVIRTWRTWADRHGLDAEQILQVCHGRRTEDTVALFLPEQEQAAATAELEELELTDLEGVTALPAAAALLQELPAGRWAAVTSGSRTLMHARMSAAGLTVPEVMIAADDVTAGKPDPQGYLQAAAACGFDIGQCLVVEDAPAGVQAGRAAGAMTLGVATTHEESQLADADAVVADLTGCTVKVSGGGVVVVAG